MPILPLPVPAFKEYGRPLDPYHPAAGSGRAVFLDRDGVVNLRRLFLVRRWSHFRFVPGVEAALAKLAALPAYILVVTNQDMVGAGYVRETELTGIHTEMTSAVAAVGGRIDAVYACVHAPGVDCSCRKPKPGMLKAAAERFSLDPAKCWMIGDNAKDMRAGRAFGCRTVLVDPRLRTRLQSADKFADHVFDDTPRALDWVATEVARDARVVA